MPEVQSWFHFVKLSTDLVLIVFPTEAFICFIQTEAPSTWNIFHVSEQRWELFNSMEGFPQRVRLLLGIVAWLIILNYRWSLTVHHQVRRDSTSNFQRRFDDLNAVWRTLSAEEIISDQAILDINYLYCECRIVTDLNTWAWSSTDNTSLHIYIGGMNSILSFFKFIMSYNIMLSGDIACHFHTWFT